MISRSTTWTFSGAEFDGVATKLVVAENPLAGAPAFTIEARLCPTSGGPFEQRFLHLQGDDGTRALLELRATPSGWYGDVFMRVGASERFFNDPRKLHPYDAWAGMALVYDGCALRQYVNGELEGEAAIAAGVLGPGQTSIGMRLNDISPYKGEIAQVRFAPRALSAGELWSASCNRS